MAKMIGLTMLGMLTGHERTAAELEALVTSAGLRFDGITATPSPMSVLHATVTGSSRRSPHVRGVCVRFSDLVS